MNYIREGQEKSRKKAETVTHYACLSIHARRNPEWLQCNSILSQSHISSKMDES